MNIYTLLNILMIAVSVIVVALGVIIGYKRGTRRSLVRLVYILIIGVITLFLSAVISKPISGSIMSLIQTLYNGTLRQIAENSANFEPIIEWLIASLIIPILFPLVFIIFQALSMIKFKTIADKITSRIKKDGDPMNKKSRLIGAGIGSLQGMIVSFILILPLILGAFIIKPIFNPTPPDGAVIASQSKGIQSRSTSLCLARPLSLTGNLLQVGGDVTTYPPPAIPRRPAPTATSLVFTVPLAAYTAGAVFGASWNSPEFRAAFAVLLAQALMIDPSRIHIPVPVYPPFVTDGSDNNDTNDILNMIAASIPFIEQSPVLCEFAADLLNTAAVIWESGESFLGISLDPSDSINSTIFSALINSLEGATDDNIVGILSTYFLPDESGSAPASMAMNIILDDGIDYNSEDMLDTLADMLITLNGNEDTSHLTSSMGEAGKKLIVEAGIVAFPAENSAAYEEMKSVLDETLAKRSYIPAVLHLAFKLLRELSAQFLTVHIWAAADHCAMFGYFFINNYINFIA